LPLPAQTVRFGPFQLDLNSAELRANGTTTKLAEQPFHILTELVRHPGEVVTRDELRRCLWRSDTYVDFEYGLNAAVKRLRDALGDSAESPNYIETIPRRGYRLMVSVESFVAPVHDRRDPAHAATASQTPGKSPAGWQKCTAAGVAAVAVALAANIWHLQGGDATRIDSIAVLPFTNEGGDPQQQYFADGMTEALITRLSEAGVPKVISRTSVMRFRGVTRSLPEIARELHVNGVLEGAVLRSGDRVRITAQLIYAPSDTHLWAKSYEGDLRDVLTLQSEVAQAIANEIKTKVSPGQQAYLAVAHTVNPEAYELYLKGRYEWNKRTAEGLKKSLEYFQQAIGLDPTYALAYSGLADSYITFANNSLVPGIEVDRKAKLAAQRAIELNPASAEAHTSLAMVLFDYDRDWQAAQKEFQAAIKLNANYANAHHWYAFRLAEMGQNEEALAEIQKAQKLDPLSVRVNANVALILYEGRQYDRAIIEARKALDLEPDDAATHDRLGDIYLQKGMPQEALAEFREAFHPGRIHAYVALGNRSEGLRILNKLKQESREHYVSPWEIARACTALGQNEDALALLEKGFETYSGGMDRLRVDPEFDPLRPDPRFQDLLRRMRLLQ